MTEKPEGEPCEKRWESQQQGQHHTQGFVISVEDVGFPLKKNGKDLKSFKLESDSNTSVFFTNLSGWLLCGEWIVGKQHWRQGDPLGDECARNSENGNGFGDKQIDS